MKSIGDELAEGHSFGSWQSAKEWAHARAKQDARDWLAKNGPVPSAFPHRTVWLKNAIEEMSHDVPLFLRQEYIGDFMVLVTNPEMNTDGPIRDAESEAK